MPEGKLTVKDLLLATLTEEGQSYKDLQTKVKGHSNRYLSEVLCELKDEGLAVREKIAKRGSGRNVDRLHEPKVLWRKA